MAALSGQDEESSRRIVSQFLHERCLPFLHSKSGRGFHLNNQNLAEETFRMLKLSVTPCGGTRRS